MRALCQARRRRGPTHLCAPTQRASLSVLSVFLQPSSFSPFSLGADLELARAEPSECGTQMAEPGLQRQQWMAAREAYGGSCHNKAPSSNCTFFAQMSRLKQHLKLPLGTAVRCFGVALIKPWLCLHWLKESIGQCDKVRQEA